MLMSLMVFLWFYAGEPPPSAQYAEFKTSRMKAMVGDNGQLDVHRAGYNGIYSLTSTEQSVSPFVPSYAGLNLEHYFDARPMADETRIKFEPRRAPMAFTKIDAATAELHQPESPVYGVESRTRLRFREPYYVDLSFTCIPHKPVRGDFLGCFWASYIHAPEDKSMYFLVAGSSMDAPQWVQFCTQQHDRDSTVLAETDHEPISFESGPSMLYTNFSPLRYAEPFFYGRVRNMVLIYIFERGKNVRFAHSPSGGGKTSAGDDTHPAWDFQFLVPHPEIGSEYTLNMRMVYAPWVDRAEVLREAARYWSSRN